MTIESNRMALRGHSMTAAERAKGRFMRSPDGHSQGQQQQQQQRQQEDDAQAGAKPGQGEDLAAEIERLRADLASRDARLATFEGLDPAAARAAIADRDAAEAARLAAERQAAEAAGNWERVRELMAQEHDAKEARLNAQIEELRTGSATTQQRLDSLTLDNAFADSAFVRNSMALSPAKVRQLYGGHVDLVDGAPVVFDKPRGSADRTIVVDGRGKPMSFNDAIKKVVEADPDKDSMLKSDVRSGAGSRGAEGGKPATDKPVNRQEIFSKGFAELRAARR